MSRGVQLVRHLSEEELRVLIRGERDGRMRERLIFIMSLYEGESVECAARKLGRVKATAYSWLRRWNQGGAEGLRPDFSKAGRPSKLSAEEREELRMILKAQGCWTTREVRTLIQESFGAEYSVMSVYRLLRGLGLRYGKPYPKDYRRPEDAEERLKRSLEAALETEEEEKEGHGDLLVGFLDECRPQTGSNTQRVWSLGKPETKRDTTHYRANTFGFYAPGGESLVGFKERSRKEDVCEFLEEMRERNPDGRILLILDNFRSHRAEVTRERAEELDVRLVFLPPYSPDLNPIEQVWRGLKRALSTAFFRTRNGFLSVIEEAYLLLTGKTSFVEGWFQRFIPEKFNQLCY